MSDPFNNVNLLRIVQEGETDADSPLSEELMSQLRENWEVLTMLMLYTGDSGTATQNPPNDATGVLTDGAASYDTDEHNGRTLVIIDGTAAGNYYTIDDTTGTTLACTGDNLYADGVRSGDAYKVFYNLQNTYGHNHDGVNSNKEQMCHIAYGSYTGDGHSDIGGDSGQEITSIGFTPQLVWVSPHASSSSNASYVRWAGMTNEYCLDVGNGAILHFGINTFEADGFTVDDGGTNRHPNKTSVSYDYVVLG